MKRLKRWAVRKVRPLIDEAVRPTLEAAVPPILDAAAHRAMTEASATLVAPLREAGNAAAQQLADASRAAAASQAASLETTRAASQAIDASKVAEAVLLEVQHVAQTASAKVQAAAAEVTGLAEVSKTATVEATRAAEASQATSAETTRAAQASQAAASQAIDASKLAEAVLLEVQHVTQTASKKVQAAAAEVAGVAENVSAALARTEQVQAAHVARAAEAAQAAHAAHAAVQGAAEIASQAAAQSSAYVAHQEQKLQVLMQQVEALAQLQSTIERQLAFTIGHATILDHLRGEKERSHPGMRPAPDLPGRVREIVRKHAGLPAQVSGQDEEADLLAEVRFLSDNSALVRPMLELCTGKRVLYPGQCYYNMWYLSRSLRELGWKADVLNWDSNPDSQIYYHGEDFRFVGQPDEALQSLRFYVAALYGYDVFHFSNAQGITFGWALAPMLGRLLGEHGEIHLLRALGKKIVYTNNGCLDGVSQTAFSQWGPGSVCSICRWRNEPGVCSDQRNLDWGRFRNSVSDYQCLLGGNRVDYNDDPRVHESPWVYALDPDFWRPGLEIPARFRIQRRSENTVVLYHAVGNKADRTTEEGVNIKSSHVYLPLLRKLREEGWDLEVVEPLNVPNREVRFLQAQADIFLDMLSFGWFGANAREAMMLGKPVVCFIRPEWLESLREEIPEYAEELPVVSATLETVEAVLRDLMTNPDKRAEIGRRSREFMVRWHSGAAAAAHFDSVYRRLLRGDHLYRPAAR